MTMQPHLGEERVRLCPPFRLPVALALTVAFMLFPFGESATQPETSSAQSQDVLYVANFDMQNQVSGTVSVVDPNGSDPVVGTVGLGPKANPVGVAVRPPVGQDRGRVYVTNFGINSVSVIDLATNQPIDAVTHQPISDPAGQPLRITVGNHPKGVAMSPDGKYVYVANFDGVTGRDARAGIPNGTVSVIDAANDTPLLDSTGQPLQIQVGRGPSSVAVSPNSSSVYVTNALDGTVSVIDATRKPTSPAGTPRVTQIRVGSYPVAVAVASDSRGTWAYVANLGDDTVSVINSAANRVEAVVRGVNVPNNVVVAGRWLYVTSQFYKAVSIVDTQSWQVVDKVEVEGAPAQAGQAVICDGAAASTDGTRVYLTYSVEDSARAAQLSSLAVIDTQARMVCNRVTVAVNSRALGVAAGGMDGRIYVTGFEANMVSVVDPALPDAAIANVPVGANPEGIALAANGRIYVANSRENSVSVIDPATNRVADPVPLPPPAGDTATTVSLAASPVSDMVYAVCDVFNSSNTTDWDHQRLWAISCATGVPPVPVTLPVSPSNSPFCLALSRDGSRIYVAGTDKSQRNVLLVMDATRSPPAPLRDENNENVEIPVGRDPCGVAVSPDDRWVFVTNNYDGNVSVIDTMPGTSRVPVALSADPSGTPLTIPAGDSPEGIAAGTSRSDRHTYLYIATIQANSQGVLDVVDASSVAALQNASKGIQVSCIPAGPNPTGVALSPDGNTAYVTDNATDADCNSILSVVSVINTSTGRVHTAPVGRQPKGLVVRPMPSSAPTSPGEPLCGTSGGP